MLRKLLTYKPISFSLILLWLFFSLAAPILSYSPEATTKIFPPLIPYDAESIDYRNGHGVGPLDEQNVESLYERHWLGTDDLGRDVLAQLIHGSSTALIIGVLSILLASIIGIFMGLVAGYFGDHLWRMNRHKFYSYLLAAIVFTILLFSIVPWTVDGVHTLDMCIAIILCLGSSLVIYLLVKFLLIKLLKKKKEATIKIPLDSLISRLIESMESLPLLLLLIAFSSFVAPSYTSLVLMISLVAWSGIARFCRAEILRLKESSFIENSKSLGYGHFRILIRHLLPNALPTLSVSIAFAISAAIMIESTLSFLGMGLQATEASWGALMASARADYSAWWLAIFPGLALFSVIYSLNSLADFISESNYSGYSKRT